MSKSVEYVGRQSGRGFPRLVNSLDPRSFKWGDASSGVTPSLVPVTRERDLGGEPRAEEIERFDVEFDMIARSFGIFLRELQEKYADTWNLIGSSPLARTEMELGVEREIIVRMSPLSSREVKVRPKYVRRPKPGVVFGW